MVKKAFVLLGSLVLLAASAYGDGVVTTVYTSVAPNAYGSPSYSDYVSNAIYALMNGLGAWGNPNDPSYYSQQTAISISQMIVTGFPSWDGQADPGDVFGSAYANELGNRPLFGVVIDAGTGAPSISISELSFSATSNDPGALLDFGFAQGSYNYSSNYVGVIFGTDGNPDTYITSGPNTQLVNEIVGRGSGNADAAYCSGCTIAQQQAAINALYGDFNVMTQFSGTYTLTDPDGDILSSGSGEYDVAPEPGSFSMMLGAALTLGLVFVRRRRQPPQR
ncbi:MAG: PEP-CTERM sorting domain-containing protein [Bryobacteraceae bacterium]|jgi:hypothetical protein